jgi:hypothetical protein
MQSTPNISSEEELLQLRNEGKINQAEYRQLSDAMRKRSEVKQPAVEQEKPGTGSKRALGVTAFCIMLAGLIIPAACYAALEYAAHNEHQESVLRGTGQPAALHSVQPTAGPMHVGIGPWFFLLVGFEIAAFVLGVIAWPDVFAKATVVCLSSIVVLVIVFALLFAA